MNFVLFLALTLLGTHGLVVRGDGSTQPTPAVKNETASTDAAALSTVTSAPSNVTSAPNPTTICEGNGCEVDDACSSVSDCRFTGAICQDKKKCVCQVGYYLDKKENKCAQTYCTKPEDCDPASVKGIAPKGIICSIGNHTCMCDTEYWHLDEAEARCINDKKPAWVWWTLAILIAIILGAIIVTVLVCKGMCYCCGCIGGTGGSSSSSSKQSKKGSSKP